jgi:hypothetical protein
MLSLIFALSGCSASDNNVVHKEGNLIITNYSEREIANITISHAGEVISVSAEPIKDTQVCYFSIEPEDEYAYTVSFIDNDGNELSQEFTDDFTEENKILIAVQYSDNEWSIAYDK